MPKRKKPDADGREYIADLNISDDDFNLLLQKIENGEEEYAISREDNEESRRHLKEFNANEELQIPEKYADYANPEKIDRSWRPTTCEVIQRLEEIDWKSHSVEEKKLIFAVFAEAAQKDLDELERKGETQNIYMKIYSEYVYAIAYRTTWAYAHRFYSDKNEIQDHVAEALKKVALNPKLIARYDKTYAPSTFLSGLIRTALSDAFYANTGRSKKLKLIKTDIKHVDELYDKFDPSHEAGKLPLRLYYVLLEMRRAVPAAWQDIECIINKQEADIVYDDAESLEQIAQASSEFETEDLEDSPMFQAVKDVLKDPNDIRIFVKFFENSQSRAFYKQAKRQKDPELKRYEEILGILSRDKRIRAFSSQDRKMGRTHLTLGRSHIPDGTLENIAFGELEDHIERD